MSKKYDAVIIGAGVSGLIAAKNLEDYNLNVLMLEKDDRAGGRLKTDIKDFYILDHGFQVLQTAYPLAKKYLDYDALKLQYFKAGAICFNEDKKFEFYDSREGKLQGIKNIFRPVGTPMDKVRLGNLRARVKRMDVEDIFQLPEMSTLNFLKKKYFSDKIIERFFKPFFGGVFLDQRLDTSSRMFLFTLKMFAEGYAAVPAAGMEEIPKQLKSQLERTEFRFHTEVDKVLKDRVKLTGGEEIECEKIIIATNPDPIISRLKTTQKWRETATYYFAADKSVIDKNVLALNFGKRQIVNNFCVISDIASTYAPKGKHLVVVSLNKIPDKTEEEVSNIIKKELARSFGKQVEGWQYLQSYHIPQALPVPQNMQYSVPFTETRLKEGIYLAGDQLLNGSLNAAMMSGELAARAVVLDS